ncbi:MAG: hypothetical protein WAM17_01765 [Rhodoplanes sp.]
MFTGRDALVSIEQAISRTRNEESRLDGALRSAMEEAARLRGEEAEGFRTVAQVKLDSLMRNQLVNDLEATERRALEMVRNHVRELEELARQRDTAQAALDAAEATKHERDQKLVEALEAVLALRARSAERMKLDPDWQEATIALASATEIAGNAETKASLAESDLAEKGKPYQDDPLFMYLWNKKHGQAEDSSGTLVRFFDRKVARLVGYHNARANYAMLNDIPLRLREHARRKQADVEAVKAQLSEIERRGMVAEGIEGLKQRVAAAEDAMRAAAEVVVKLTAELKAVEAERQKAVSGADAVYQRAVDLLAQTLSREDLRQLYQDAISTPFKTDDQAILAISAARKALQTADGEVSQIRSEIRELARRRSELEGARDRARHQGYDDPRGTFGGGPDMLGQVIGGILSGALQGAVIDRILRDNYRAPFPGPDRDFGGPIGAPSWPNPWHDSGGWPGGGHSGDSGWRTGGGF